MITAYGMSDKLGRVRYQANEQEVFLGHAVTQHQNVSEATAQIIDQEVRRLIEEAEGRARTILTDRLDDLHTIAKALLEYESLSNDEIDRVLRGEKIVRDDSGGAGPGHDRRRRASVPTSSGQNPAGGASPGPNPEPQPGV
jgi:cell division protease FtsH